METKDRKAHPFDCEVKNLRPLTGATKIISEEVAAHYGITVKSVLEEANNRRHIYKVSEARHVIIFLVFHMCGNEEGKHPKTSEVSAPFRRSRSIVTIANRKVSFLSQNDPSFRRELEVIKNKIIKRLTDYENNNQSALNEHET